MTKLSFYLGILVLVAGVFARNDENESGERTYQIPNLAEDGPKHDFSSSDENSSEDIPKPRAKRTANFMRDLETEEQHYDETHEDDDDKTSLDWADFSLILKALTKPLDAVESYESSEEVEATTLPPTESNQWKWFYPVANNDHENEVTYESREDTSESVEIKKDLVPQYAPALPSVEAKGTVTAYQMFQPFFREPQESHNVVIMVDDVKIEVTRQPRPQTIPFPYYYSYYI